MILTSLYRKILRRPFFFGQDRIFNYWFKRGRLKIGLVTAKPSTGNFNINCDTATWIGARIFYLGDYEPYLKKIFKSIIKKGDTILDVGSNIGFHALYFAELTGESGKVIAFEPVPHNFKSLLNNISINSFQNIEPKNLALSNKNEQLFINADEFSENPGAFNLFNLNGEIAIDCVIGDEIITEKIDFIKIDVEGYESFVIDGLKHKIEKDKPTLIFEYDSSYHQKTGLPNTFILDVLQPLGYSFSEISRSGLKPLVLERISSCNILAKPN